MNEKDKLYFETNIPKIIPFQFISKEKMILKVIIKIIFKKLYLN